ncbi:uncharacterized protein EV420DRAFT_1511489 [Desarmillaria tabescens]|uniref:Uncharacterized protein n=1 Tax=Armillaria tabescens TaxID=1929756 RepID=A0AA39NIS1_ARMTA|nr:uncharacterized protein EV420DRAFT_1511489 [Desarmillaria tabescens]KAK0466404.1 hypothetical protein EV420DRAFT_1511489 [Desarmillaria tabescens]
MKGYRPIFLLQASSALLPLRSIVNSHLICSSSLRTEPLLIIGIPPHTKKVEDAYPFQAIITRFKRQCGQGT